MFLNPLMLLGISAVGVPIIIHLLNRRKFDRVVWGAMRFLRISVEQNRRRIKIEDILLLALRCLLLMLLALALARPVLRSAMAALGPAQVTAVILLDNSYSMSQTDGVESRFQAARSAAEQIIRGLPTGSSAAVLSVSDIVEGLIPEPTYDLTLAISKVKEAPLYDRATNLHEGIKASLAVLQTKSAAQKEIYIITDGQASGWQRLTEIHKLLQEARSDVRAHLLLVGANAERNLGISVLRVNGGLAAINQPVRLEVRVKNHSRTEAANVNVSIAVDSDPPMDQAVVNSIPAGEERSISLFARLKEEGYHTITAKIDPDHLPADDTRSVAIRAVKDVKVLLIDGDSGREPRDSEVFFLKTALRPVPRAQWDDYFVKLAVKVPTELETVRFADFDAVIAANVTDFSQATLAQLVSYLRGGGALWVFPGDNINRAFYNEQLYRRQGILPAALGDTRGDAKVQDKWFALADKEHAHDIISLWRDTAAGTLSGARFFKAYDLRVGRRSDGGGEERHGGTEARRHEGEGSDEATKRRSDEGEERDSALSTQDSELRTSLPRVVARFADDRPAMVEHDFGQGRVVVFASTADTEWTDLPARAGIFLPLVHRTLAYLVARQDEHLTIGVGRSFVHTAPIEATGKYASITKRARSYSAQTTDSPELEESRQIELVGGSTLLQFDKTDFAGPYEAKVNDTMLVRFAAQSDPRESDLTPLSESQRQTLGEVAQVIQWMPGSSLGATLEQARIGAELWLPLAMAALVLATMETLLAHWFSKPK